MNKIEVKGILFLDPSIGKADHIRNSRERQRFRSCFFAKYFPKHLRNFDFQTKSSSIKSKMKRIKIMKNFGDDPSSPPLKVLEYRLLLGDKVRFIKTLSSENAQSPAHLLEKIKLFTNLRSIQLYFGVNPRSYGDPDGIESQYLIKALREIKRLKSIKSLGFNQLVNSSASLIHAIDASPKLLRSLEALALSSFGSGVGDEKVLEIIKDCKNLLKYVTFLDLASLRSPSHFKDFKSLQGSCPNLRNLSFQFRNRNICYSARRAESSFEYFPVEINYFSAIKTFQNLRSLQLYIVDTFTFLKDFTPPPLIKNLLLSFKECLTKEIMIRIDKAFDTKDEKRVLELFETNQTLVKLYNNFKPLYHLEFLEIFFSSDVGLEDYQHHNYLSQGLVKNIPSLNKLTFVGGSSYRELNKPDRSPVQDLYLPEFLKSCHPSTLSLQTLEIGHEKVIFSDFNLFSSRNKFPSLSTLTLAGVIDKNDPSNTEIGLFLKQIMTLGPSLTTIKLRTFVHATVESLLSLLQQLNQLERPGNLQLKLQIKFYKHKDLEYLGAGFEKIIKELQENQVEYAKLQGVSLTIYMSEAKYAKEFLEVYGKKFDSFKIVFPGYEFANFE